jgi:hypothetical protein
LVGIHANLQPRLPTEVGQCVGNRLSRYVEWPRALGRGRLRLCQGRRTYSSNRGQGEQRTSPKREISKLPAALRTHLIDPHIKVGLTRNRYCEAVA